MSKQSLLAITIILILISASLIIKEMFLKPPQVIFTYPQIVENYTLLDKYEEKECRAYEEGEVCREEIRLQYEDLSTHKGVFVFLTNITKGKNFLIAALETSLIGMEKAGYSIFVLIDSFNISRGFEPHELIWWISPTQLIYIQEYEATVFPTGKSYSYGIATGKNPVVKWFLEHFKPI